MLCYVMLSLLPCERRTRVHTAADSVGGAMTAIASLPEPGDVDGTLLELEYRKRLEMFTRRQDARSVASCASRTVEMFISDAPPGARPRYSGRGQSVRTVRLSATH